MRLNHRNNFIPSVFVCSMLLLGSGAAMAAPAELCSLLSASEVAKIIGNEAPIVANTSKVDEKGTTISLCVYSAMRRPPLNAATLRLHTFKSAAAAQEFMKSYGDVKSYGSAIKPERGDVIEQDKAAGMPAIFQNIHGRGEMSAIKGNKVISAGVTHTSADGKQTAERGLSRTLLAAMLGKL